MKRYLTFVALGAAVGCGSPDANNAQENNVSVNNGTELEVPDSYGFESRYAEGESSVSYSGQVARQVLIRDLKGFIGGMNDEIESGSLQIGGEGSVVTALDFYFRFDSDSYGEEPIGVTTEPPPAQETYVGISSGKDLVGKLAGNDSITDHKDWSSEFTGWQDADIAEHGGGVDSPEAFVTALFEQIEANAIAQADGTERLGPDGEPLPVHITEEGWDLAQLTEKFLHGAVAFSQGADDYLDDDVEGKGLLSANTQDDDAPYTSLEHQWDEGFGYFGAARAYLDFSDDEVADVGYQDIDGDGAIDLNSEFNFGVSTNAAKRDRGSQTGTTLREDAFQAFLAGRALIASAEEGEVLDEATLSKVKGFRDDAVLAWEKALAATVVHYINDTIEDSEKLGEDDYDFEHHAKVWSEMKGFAMAFQFNPRSPLTDQQFEQVHLLLRDKPELDPSSAESYVEDLLEARGILQDAYQFDAADVEAW